jgi:hypothetical protein
VSGNLGSIYHRGAWQRCKLEMAQSASCSMVAFKLAVKCIIILVGHGTDHSQMERQLEPSRLSLGTPRGSGLALAEIGCSSCRRHRVVFFDIFDLFFPLKPLTCLFEGVGHDVYVFTCGKLLLCE